MGFFKNVKWHFYILEFFSIFVLLWIMLALLFNFFYINFNSGGQEENQIVAKIKFTENLNFNKYNYDLQLDVTHIAFDACQINYNGKVEKKLGYIILNKSYLNLDEPKSQLIAHINYLGIESCYIYKDCESVKRGKGIFYGLKSYSMDFFNLIIFSFLFIFSLFMKINIFKLHTVTYRIMKKEKL